MSTRAQMPLPLPAVTECGYCERLLTAHPAGDFACDPCRRLMRQIVVGPPGVLPAQFARFQREARPVSPVTNQPKEGTTDA